MSATIPLANDSALSMGLAVVALLPLLFSFPTAANDDDGTAENDAIDPFAPDREAYPEPRVRIFGEDVGEEPAARDDNKAAVRTTEPTRDTEYPNLNSRKPHDIGAAFAGR